MGKQLFSKEIEEKIVHPFVFISYCQLDERVKERVQKLALYLEKNGIVVVYDEGGLKAGEELRHFMKLIIHKNCKYVLVVCDKFYLEKADNQTGGAWEEYKLVQNDYDDNALKYIPLKVGNNMLPLFSGKIYVEFESDNDNTMAVIKNAIGCIDNRNANIAEDVYKKVKELKERADNLHGNGDYEIAKVIIEDAIKLYESMKKKSKTFAASLYNLAICIYLDAGSDGCSMIADKLFEAIHGKMPYSKKADYYINCSLAYLKDFSMEKCEECALLAYNNAKKGGVELLEEYTLMYSSVLYTTKQYKNSYKFIHEAWNDFVSNHSIDKEYTELDVKNYIRIKSNIAEIALACSQMPSNGYNEKYMYLSEAKVTICEVLNYINNKIDDLDDEYLCIIYKNASEIFEALNKFYMKRID